MTETTRRSFLDRQRDAALEQVREQSERRRAVQDIVLGDSTRQYVDRIISIDDDHLVLIVDRRHPDAPTWAIVHNDRRDSWRFATVDEALLYLVALRAGTSTQDAGTAAHYAARVLGLASD